MKIAQLILTHNNHDLTKNLLKTFPEAIVVDNGSTIPVDYMDNVIRFDTNLGFTKGWNESIKRVYGDYDAFWLCNNDIDTEHICVTRLEEVLESHPRLGVVSPFCNSPHAHMGRKTPDWLRYVPYVELVAPLIRKDVFNRVGLFDETYSKGWGLDYDFGWKVRRSGYAVGVYDLVGINHLEHKTIDSVGREQYFAEASAEMNTGLTQNYGSDWQRKLTSMIALTMVVCNEEKRLYKFFDTHTHLFDEIVVAVQESKDNSLSVCKSYADTVIERPCVGYCEADRGVVASNTISDWQVCLDPDEYLTQDFISTFRDAIYGDKQGYRLTRRLIEDGIFRFEGDSHHRFYHRNNVHFLDELHTEPQAQDWGKVGGFPFVSIEHIKTLKETWEDEERYEDVIETKYRGTATYSAKKALNIHIRDKEKNSA